MNDKDKPESNQPTKSTLTELRSRQSVRATFKLTDQCIEAISIVAAQLGIKQKSLFDHLFTDARSLAAIARKFRNTRFNSANRVQKTFVISRGALGSLEDTARSFNAPRDMLIELSVQRLLPMIAHERQRHLRRKAVFIQIHKHLKAGRKLLEEAVDKLGEEDPLTDRLGAAMNAYEQAFRHITVFLDKSGGIESFEPDNYGQVGLVSETD